MKEDNPGTRKDHRVSRGGDPVSGVMGGLTLIFLGVLFLMTINDYISWSDWWAYLLIGLGIILIIEVVIRAFLPSSRHFSGGKLVIGCILIVLGATNIYGITRWWPLILIAVGIAVILSNARK
ncbi:MAG: hypothetical protein JXB26_15390 [Candidatus Aminicenantes bacterium]|nr:hypothetical protein [Candidatus Aminicenantes bacterium]